MIRIVDVAHVNLNVTDLDKAEVFYRDILGFTVSMKAEGAIIWMNMGQYRADNKIGFHDLALFKVPYGQPDNYRKRPGLNHAAFRLQTAEEVDKAADYLKSKGVKVLKGPMTHSEDNDRFVYFEDPDGNVLELVASTLPGFPQEYLRGDRRAG